MLVDDLLRIQRRDSVVFAASAAVPRAYPLAAAGLRPPTPPSPVALDARRGLRFAGRPCAVAALTSRPVRKCRCLAAAARRTLQYRCPLRSRRARSPRSLHSRALMMAAMMAAIHDLTKEHSPSWRASGGWCLVEDLTAVVQNGADRSFSDAQSRRASDNRHWLLGGTPAPAQTDQGGPVARLPCRALSRSLKYRARSWTSASESVRATWVSLTSRTDPRPLCLRATTTSPSTSRA